GARLTDWICLPTNNRPPPYPPQGPFPVPDGPVQRTRPGALVVSVLRSHPDRPSHGHGPTMTILSLRRPGIQLFAALNLLDLALTWNLLRQSAGVVTEGNPVAGWWLDCFGWPGLAAFKLGSVLVALLLLAAVARHRPAAANRALAFGCAVLLGVVLYSAFLARW